MADAARQIAFEQMGLASVLKSYHLAVPPNQREYSWTDREVTQLLQDLSKSMADGVDYFLGTIVTIPRGQDELEVVDGQQRLATTAMLLAAIRDYLRDSGDKSMTVEMITNYFLTGIDLRQDARVARLKLNVDDNELFSWIVTSNGSPQPVKQRISHERMLTAYELCAAHVRRIVAPLESTEHANLLKAWLALLEHSALIVLLRVPDDADAYKMFETLNDRGLRTSQADLIKNYLFGRAGSRINEVQARWSSMRGSLESISDEDLTTTFLRHALIVLGGFLREADVYGRVQSLANTEQSAVTLAASLDNLSNAYVATFNPENERWNSYPDRARRSLTVLNQFNIRPMRPLILAVTAKMATNQAPAALDFLVSLGVRLMIASSTRSGSVEVALADTSSKVMDGSIDTTAKLRKGLLSITPSDSEFKTAFGGARASNARLARYLLRSLEQTATGEKEPWLEPVNDAQIINLEHVLPKKPLSNWPGFTADQAGVSVNRIGNLALLRATENSAIGSDSFADKKLVYAKCPYQLTQQIAQVNDWTPGAIDAHQKVLADLAVKTWPVK